jgi:mannose/fructose/N-acetylgalactosamine-specific phosphotransferase system component IID
VCSSEHARRGGCTTIREGSKQEVAMLSTIVVVLLIMWLLGFVVYPIGNLIHILLVIAIVMVLLRIIQGRNPIRG